uniref:C-type lectin domain-containing protein n=1 Tax=Pygocentrus nattereri TaxID=42514 RepID=A0A3B4DUS8_PYGNA
VHKYLYFKLSFTTGLQPLFRLYHFVNDPKTWTKAQTYCRNRFTDLASVDSVKDMSRLMKLLVDVGYSGSLWIGLTQAVQPRWGWSRGDELLSNFSNWDAGRPNGTGKCVFTINGVWRNYDCTVALYFVCYYGESVNVFKNQVRNMLLFIFMAVGRCSYPE